MANIVEQMLGAKQTLVLWHGTFTEFSNFKISTVGTLGRGVYLTGDKEYAREYRERAVRDRSQGEYRLLTVEVTMSNP